MLIWFRNHNSRRSTWTNVFSFAVGTGGSLLLTTSHLERRPLIWAWAKNDASFGSLNIAQHLFLLLFLSIGLAFSLSSFSLFLSLSSDLSHSFYVASSLEWSVVLQSVSNCKDRFVEALLANNFVKYSLSIWKGYSFGSIDWFLQEERRRIDTESAEKIDVFIARLQRFLRLFFFVSPVMDLLYVNH